MNRLYTVVALAALVVAVAPGRAAEPKPTGTVELASSFPDLGPINSVPTPSVILSQKEWERLAADWGITASRAVNGPSGH